MKLQIFGWGTPNNNNASRELQTGGITVVERNICPQNFIDRFCAGPSFFGGCQGDDGGAVYGNRTIFGLIDYRGSNYCDEQPPGHLYINIAEYQEWINEVVNGTTKPVLSLLLFVFAALLLRNL